MNILIATFQAVAALLGIGIIGFWIIGRRHAPENVMGFLSSLSIDIAVPCLSLSSLIINFSPQTNPDWWRVPIFWMGYTVIALALALGTSYISQKSTRSEFIISLFYQNGLFFPIIILSGLFGTQNDYLAPLFLFSFLFPTMMFSTYPYFFKKSSQPADSGSPPKTSKLVLARPLNPVLIVTIIGLTFSLSGISAYVPDFIKMILIMVGAMASPLFYVDTGRHCL